MKSYIKTIALALVFLTSCTDKKADKTIENQLSTQEIQEVEQIEKLTDEMENSTKIIEEKAKELDALLDEIDN